MTKYFRFPLLYILSWILNSFKYWNEYHPSIILQLLYLNNLFSEFALFILTLSKFFNTNSVIQQMNRAKPTSLANLLPMHSLT